MANKVFANGREIACKAGSGKSICAFPDVCMTPPQTPATPPGVPIPYPNTGMAGDTTSGSKKVKVSNKEVMLKNKSYFKKSTGDEAGAAPMKGVVTHTNRGKVYFNMWSMNVKIEGENVVRHLDLTTHNHGSAPGNSPPWPYTGSMAASTMLKCEGTFKKYKLHKHKDKDCGKNMQSHHPVQNACFMSERGGEPYYNTHKYDEGDAPAICLKNSRRGSQHYRVTQKQNNWAKKLKKRPTYSQLMAQEKKNLILGVPMSKEDAECIMKVVDAYMKSIKIKKETLLRIPGS
jgi:hypothetical protein